MKELIKKIGCGTIAIIGINRLFRFNTRIIAFHTVNPKYFESQMRFIKKNYNVVSLQEALKDLDRKQVVITFDDGYRNNLVHAYPVLKKLGLKATVYVTHEFIEKDIFTWWDRIEYKGVDADFTELKKLVPSEVEKTVKDLTGLSKSSKQLIKTKKKKPFEIAFDINKFMVDEILKCKN